MCAAAPSPPPQGEPADTASTTPATAKPTEPFT
jgi:hypothetical protein